MENDLFDFHPALGQFILFRASHHLFNHIYEEPETAGDRDARAIIARSRDDFDYEHTQACNSIYRWVNRLCGWREE